MTTDPFGTSSGLIDHYIGTVEESWFGINPQYQENVTLLMWRVRLDNPEDYPQLPDGYTQEQFSVGPVWESYDGGATIEYPGKENARVNSNTQYGVILTRAIHDWNMRGVLESKGEGATEAKIWIGCRFEFTAEARKPFKNAQGETVTPGPKVMPTAFMGEGETLLKPVEVFDLDSLGLSMEELRDLTEAADKAENHGQFLDAAMKLTWLPSNGKVVTALADKSFWQALQTII